MRWTTVAWVGGLGAIGSMLRLAAGQLVPAGARWPWATLAVNLIGALVIGVVVGAFTARGAADAPARIALTTGLLGGFTTFSAFALESVALLERRAYLGCAAYVGATIVVGLAACALGLWLGAALAGGATSSR